MFLVVLSHNATLSPSSIAQRSGNYQPPHTQPRPRARPLPFAPFPFAAPRAPAPFPLPFPFPFPFIPRSQDPCHIYRTRDKGKENSTHPLDAAVSEVAFAVGLADVCSSISGAMTMWSETLQEIVVPSFQSTRYVKFFFMHRLMVPKVSFVSQPSPSSSLHSWSLL